MSQNPSKVRLADPDLAVEIAANMLQTETFEQRWEAIQNTLEALGATSINAATLCGKTKAPLWFISSLSEQVTSDYLSNGFLEHDFIVRHAATHDKLFAWLTEKTATQEITDDAKRFGNFVRDSGEKVIRCQTLREGRSAQVRAITFCSGYDPKEINDPSHLDRVDMATRLMLPWLDWPDDPSGPGFLDLPHATLTPRETEALQLLAGGLKNTRIAEAMGVTEATVAKHLISARQKLGVRTREEAIARAMTRRIIET